MSDKEVEQIINDIKQGEYDDELLKDIWVKFLKLRGWYENRITKEQHNKLAEAVIERLKEIGIIR